MENYFAPQDIPESEKLKYPSREEFAEFFEMVNLKKISFEFEWENSFGGLIDLEMRITVGSNEDAGCVDNLAKQLPGSRTVVGGNVCWVHLRISEELKDVFDEILKKR